MVSSYLLENWINPFVHLHTNLEVGIESSQLCSLPGVPFHFDPTIHMCCLGEGTDFFETSVVSDSMVPAPYDCAFAITSLHNLFFLSF
jgi:hypothetical protein